MSAQSIVAVILALCVVIYLISFQLMRGILPVELTPDHRLIQLYEEMGREVVTAIIGALSVYIGVKLGK